MKNLGLLAIACIALTGCGSQQEEPEGKTVNIIISGNNDSVVNKNDGIEQCKFYDGNLRTGDRVTLRGADDNILGVSELVADDEFKRSLNDPKLVMGVCYWDITFTDVQLNEPAYTIEIANYGEVVVSPKEIQRETLVLNPRNSFEAMFQDNAIEVDN